MQRKKKLIMLMTNTQNYCLNQLNIFGMAGQGNQFRIFLKKIIEYYITTWFQKGSAISVPFHTKNKYKK